LLKLQLRGEMIHIFRIPGAQSEQKVLQLTKDSIPSIVGVQTESCFNIGAVKGAALSADEHSKLLWLFTETFEPKNINDKSFLSLQSSTNSAIVEVGPRLAFSTAWSSNCISMCQACGVKSVDRIERSRRYKITTAESVPMTKEIIAAFAALVHDRMTECVYTEPLMSFANGEAPEPVHIVPVLTGKNRTKNSLMNG
jgi:phosphoribosylformylglycinamidine synthase